MSSSWMFAASAVAATAAAIGSGSSGSSTAGDELIAASVATTALASRSKEPQQRLTFLAIAGLGGAGFTYGLGANQTQLIVAASVGAMSMNELLDEEAKRRSRSQKQ